jgi:hypothetical protein
MQNEQQRFRAPALEEVDPAAAELLVGAALAPSRDTAGQAL